jgi:hypothetical protein
MKKEREIWRNRFLGEKPSLLVNRGTKKPLFSHCEETGGFYAHALPHRRAQAVVAAAPPPSRLCSPWLRPYRSHRRRLGRGCCRARRYHPRSGRRASVRQRCPHAVSLMQLSPRRRPLLPRPRASVQATLTVREMRARAHAGDGAKLTDDLETSFASAVGPAPGLADVQRPPLLLLLTRKKKECATLYR